MFLKGYSRQGSLNVKHCGRLRWMYESNLTAQSNHFLGSQAIEEERKGSLWSQHKYTPFKILICSKLCFGSIYQLTIVVFPEGCDSLNLNHWLDIEQTKKAKHVDLCDLNRYMVICVICCDLKCLKTQQFKHNFAPVVQEGTVEEDFVALVQDLLLLLFTLKDKKWSKTEILWDQKQLQ